MKKYNQFYIIKMIKNIIKNTENKKGIINQQRTNLLLLVDKELKTKNVFMKINSLTEKEFYEKVNENFFIELNESFSKSSAFNCFQKSTDLNNSINVNKEKIRTSQNAQSVIENNRSLSSMSHKSSNSSNNIASVETNFLTKSFSCLSSALDKNVNFFWKRDMDFKKNETEKKGEIIYRSYKKLKMLSDRLKSSFSQTPKNHSKTKYILKLKNSFETQSDNTKKKHNKFQINLKSMSKLETTDFEENIFGVNKNFDISFEEM